MSSSTLIPPNPGATALHSATGADKAPPRPPAHPTSKSKAATELQQHNKSMEDDNDSDVASADSLDSEEEGQHGDKSGSSSGECTPEHCFYAFDALYCDLFRAKPIPPQFPDGEYPLFVTWNKYQRGDWHLRGCIGNFEPLDLYEGIAEYALISAYKDSRFRKIDKSEVPDLQCGISLLTDFEQADSYLDWTIGVHGIYISFPHPSFIQQAGASEAPSPLSSSGHLPRVSSKQHFSATYLPDVIPEQGWDKIEAIDSAIHKAGWRGRITEDLRRSIKLRRYQSKKCQVVWDEYIQWRKLHTKA